MSEDNNYGRFKINQVVYNESSARTGKLIKIDKSDFMPKFIVECEHGEVQPENYMDLTVIENRTMHIKHQLNSLLKMDLPTPSKSDINVKVSILKMMDEKNVKAYENKMLWYEGHPGDKKTDQRKGVYPPQEFKMKEDSEYFKRGKILATYEILPLNIKKLVSDINLNFGKLDLLEREKLSKELNIDKKEIEKISLFSVTPSFANGFNEYPDNNKHKPIIKNDQLDISK